MPKSHFSHFAGIVIVAAGFFPAKAVAGGTVVAVPTKENVKYVGSVNCQTSMCHGGAGPERGQVAVWSNQDFHSRAYATLTTARSSLMAQSLGLSSATESSRCTTCHAPYQCTPAEELGPGVNVADGVSCEHCHNAAGFWLRGHTRYDWTDANRVAAGMRDLNNAYVRASTCVACHQVIDNDLLKAGHPELIFELDGQTASEPRHWQEKESWVGAKAWMVGQAVALRDISQRLTTNGSDDALTAEASALAWLLQQVPGVQGSGDATQPSALTAWSIQLAQATSDGAWSNEKSVQALSALSATSDSFVDTHVSHLEEAMRAERLVMGLDRISKSLVTAPPDAAQTDLTALFDAVQDRDQFDPQKFSGLLKQFAADLAPKK